MAKMSDLHALGVTDLLSFSLGRVDAYDSITKLLNKELAIALDQKDEVMQKVCESLLQTINLEAPRLEQ